MTFLKTALGLFAQFQHAHPRPLLVVLLRLIVGIVILEIPRLRQVALLQPCSCLRAHQRHLLQQNNSPTIMQATRFSGTLLP